MLSNDCSKIWESFIVIPTSMLSWELCVFVLATYALTKVDVQECVFVLTGTIRGQQSNCLVHRSWFWVWGFSTSGLSGGRETACVQGGWVMMPEASASACMCMSVGGAGNPLCSFQHPGRGLPLWRSRLSALAASQPHDNIEAPEQLPNMAGAVSAPREVPGEASIQVPDSRQLRFRWRNKVQVSGVVTPQWFGS